MCHLVMKHSRFKMLESSISGHGPIKLNKLWKKIPQHTTCINTKLLFHGNHYSKFEFLLKKIKTTRLYVRHKQVFRFENLKIYHSEQFYFRTAVFNLIIDPTSRGADNYNRYVPPYQMSNIFHNDLSTRFFQQGNHLIWPLNVI